MENKYRMQEELQQVRKDIEDLQNRLSILQKREESISNKLEIPNELVGKYIKYIDSIWTTYMRIDNIERGCFLQFDVHGPSILYTSILMERHLGLATKI